MTGCSVSGCYSGYDATHKRGPVEKKYQLIRFPKSPTIRNLWVSRLNRENWTPSESSCVCVKHFLPSDFSAVPGDLDTRGNERTMYRLKENAVPSLYLQGDETNEGQKSPRKKQFALKNIKSSPIQPIIVKLQYPTEEEKSPKKAKFEIKDDCTKIHFSNVMNQSKLEESDEKIETNLTPKGKAVYIPIGVQNENLDMSNENITYGKVMNSSSTFSRGVGRYNIVVGHFT